MFLTPRSKNKMCSAPRSYHVTLSHHSLLPSPKCAHSLIFYNNLLFVFLYNFVSIHASPNNRVWLYSFLNFEWNPHVCILLCLASFTQYGFHSLSMLCAAMVHSFSLLYHILWKCHNFSAVDGIFGLLLDNYGEFLCEPSVTRTVVFPQVRAQAWND